MDPVALPEDVIAALAKYDSPTVTNVIDLIGVRSRSAGYVNQSTQAVFPDLPPAVGYAVTATFRSAKPDADPPTFLEMIKIIDACPKPGFVVLQDLDEPVNAAAFGELMAACYQLFGCRGLLTNGACREVPRMARLKFPCWASSTIASHGCGHLCELNVPVTIGGLDIKPGDLLHGDGSGVVLIPIDIAPSLPDLCKQWVKVEQTPLDHAAKGDSDLAAYIEMTKKFKAGFGDLAARAARVLPPERRMG